MSARAYTTDEWAAAGITDLVVEMSLEDHRALGPAGIHLVARAARGDVGAQHKLGDRYRRGEAGMKKRPWQAAHWYQKAAERGHAPSQFRLGRCLESGVGRRRNLAAAVGWYERAAAQGHAGAQCALGDLHADVEWGEIGRPEALRWWRLAAAQGHVRAQFKLGWAYEQGLGVEQDLLAAARWYRAAWHRGSGPAAAALDRTRQRIAGGLIRLTRKGEGITLSELADMFPDEDAARRWCETMVWPGGELACPRCGSTNVYACTQPPMPYWCRGCKKYFSVRTGTALESSRLPLKTWVWAIHLEITSLNGVSGPQLHRALGVRQATAWSMLQRIRAGVVPLLARGYRARRGAAGYSGVLEKNKHARKRATPVRGPVNKMTVAGMKDPGTGMGNTNGVRSPDARTLRGYAGDHTDAAAKNNVAGHVNGADRPARAEAPHGGRYLSV